MDSTTLDFTALDSTTFAGRVEERFSQLSLAITEGIKAALGTTRQKVLAKAIGKHRSTVSRHLSGGVNLTMKTIVAYENELPVGVIEVPGLRRSEPRGRRAEERSRRPLTHIDPVARRLQHLLNDISARIGSLLSEKNGMSQEELADRMGKDPGYISRVMGSGVNLTLKTIAAFEVALDASILSVRADDTARESVERESVERESADDGSRTVTIRAFDEHFVGSSDGGYFRGSKDIPFAGEGYAWEHGSMPDEDEELIAA